MFQPNLSFLLLMVLLETGLCQNTRVIMKLPDDQIFRLTNFAYLTIQGVSQIDAVHCTPDLGDSLTVDKSTAQQKIKIKADLTSGTPYSLTVTAGAKSHILNLIVEQIPTDAISNAVFITAPTSKMQTELSRIASSTRLIYRLAINASIIEAAVQVRKPGSSMEFLPLWQAYDWMWNETKASGVILMPERCPKKSNKMCRTRLAFPSGHPAVHEAAVELNKQDNFMGFNLKWEAQSVDEMHRESCGPSTCLNNGICDNNYTGIGFRCICPSSPTNVPWGPRCEHPVRSYYHDSSISDPNAFTRHWIGDLPHSAKTIEFSFEFSGAQKDTRNPPVFALSSAVDIDKPLIKISIKSADQIEISGKFLKSSIDLEKVNDLNPSKNNWHFIRIYVETDRIYLVICGKNLDGACANKITFKSSEKADFRNLWIDIGRGLFGCVRSVNVNGYSVDLAAGTVFNTLSVSLNRTRVERTCILQDQGCKANFPAEACGEHSVCYGNAMTKPSSTTSASISCNCKCTGSMRKIFEKTDNKCSDSADNTCTKKPYIITTKSDTEIKWTLNNQPVALPSESQMTIELEIRTRTSDAPKMITAGIHYKNGRGPYRRDVKLKAGKLFLSIETDEYSFPPVKIDDGEWHSVSVVTALNLATLTIDGMSKTYFLHSNYDSMKSVDLSAAIASSWLRNIRVSGIYMTTDNNRDFTQDQSRNKIMVKSPTDVQVNQNGTEINPKLCDNVQCTRGERCVRQWGQTICECQIGQLRNNMGICCVIGGQCNTADTALATSTLPTSSKTTQAFSTQALPRPQTPPKNVSELVKALSRPSQNSPDNEIPSSNYNTWIGLIIGMVALVLLVALIVTVILIRRSKATLGGVGTMQDSSMHAQPHVR